MSDGSLAIKLVTPIPVKKNSYKIGNKKLYKPKEITEFEDEVGVQLMEQGINYRNQIKGPFKISATFYVKNGSKDMDGMLTSILDALEMFEIIENDKYWHFTDHLEKRILTRYCEDEEHVALILSPFVR